MEALLRRPRVEVATQVEALPFVCSTMPFVPALLAESKSAPVRRRYVDWSPVAVMPAAKVEVAAAFEVMTPVFDIEKSRVMEEAVLDPTSKSV